MNESYDPASHFLILAIIVFYWQLFRIGQQPPPSEKPRDESAAGSNVGLRGALHRESASPLRGSNSEKNHGSPTLAHILEDIQAADDRFEEGAFLKGASRAYESVLNAYASGDTAVIDHLVDPEAATTLKNAIAERQDKGEEFALQFIGVKKLEILSAWMEADSAEISVRFLSELVTSTRAADGSIIAGDPAKIVEVVDLWTFARRVSTGNPNWMVLATEGG